MKQESRRLQMDEKKVLFEPPGTSPEYTQAHFNHDNYNHTNHDNPCCKDSDNQARGTPPDPSGYRSDQIIPLQENQLYKRNFGLDMK